GEPKNSIGRVPSRWAGVTKYVPVTVGTHTAYIERTFKPVHTPVIAPSGSPIKAVRSFGGVYKRLAAADAPASPKSLPGVRSSARAAEPARNAMRNRVIEALRIVLPPRPPVRVRNVTAPPCDDKNRNQYSSGGARGQEPPPYRPRSGRRLVGARGERERLLGERVGRTVASLSMPRR